MIDVNLLPEQKVSSMRVNHAKKLVIVGTVAFSVIWWTGVVGLFIYSQILASRVSDLNGRLASANSRMAGLNTELTSLVSLKQKVSGISYLQKNSFDFPNALTYILKIFPSGVDISSVSVSDNALVTLAGKTTSSAIVSTFLAGLATDSTLKYPTMTGFRYTDDGKFVFSVAAFYGQPIKKSRTN